MNNSISNNSSELLLQRLLQDEGFMGRMENLKNFVFASGKAEITEDMEFLSLLASEALKGVDIQSRYSGAFARIMEVPELQETFMAVLEALGDDSTETAGAEVPGATLMAVGGAVKPGVQPDSWQVNWDLGREVLSALFRPTELVFRSTGMDEEARWLTLLRDEVVLGKNRAIVVLDGRLNDDGELEPHLKLALEDAESGQSAEYTVSGELVWGEMQVDIPNTNRYQIPLKPIPLAGLVSEGDNAPGAPLRITIFVNSSA